MLLNCAKSKGTAPFSIEDKRLTAVAATHTEPFLLDADHTLPAQRLAQLHKALADTLRLQILRLLRNESFGVLELCRFRHCRHA